MAINYCRRCGSNSFRADRSLGGRVICNRCSSPIDSKTGISSFIGIENLRIKKRNTLFFIGAVGTVILIIFLSS